MRADREEHGVENALALRVEAIPEGVAAVRCTLTAWMDAKSLRIVGWQIAPGAGNAVRLIADPPLVGLAANALPDPKTIPNNHWSYAIQWFLFAGGALIIYALALRKRLAVPRAGG